MKGADVAARRACAKGVEYSSAIRAARSCRSTTRCSAPAPAHPGPPRAGRGVRGRRLRAVTRPAGVCLATSGPGATNLVTGIANASWTPCRWSRSPARCASPLMGTDAFQEVDIFGITLPIVKHSYIVRHARTCRASSRSLPHRPSGRPGPVLIDLPKDIAAGAAHDAPRAVAPPATRARGRTRPLDRAAATDRGGRAAGRLCRRRHRHRRAPRRLRDFVQATGIPVVAHAKGLGAVPTDEPLFLGMLGMHGTRAANTPCRNCDLLICVGARFDDRATGKLDSFAPNARVIHIDVDPAEIGKLRDAEVALAGDMAASSTRCSCRPRIAAVAAAMPRAQARARLALRRAGRGRLRAGAAQGTGRAGADGNLIVTCDVGQHQMWVAQHCRFAARRRT